MKEDTLTRLRAEGMTYAQLICEVSRIQRALVACTDPKQQRRWQRRLEIMTTEQANRIP